MITVGIDPGINGGIAFYDGDVLGIVKIPSVKAKGRGRVVEWDALYENININMSLFKPLIESSYIFIEQVWAMPGQGVSSMFKFGYISGWLRGRFEGWGEIHMVSPQKWKKHFGLSSDKDASRKLAMCNFPKDSEKFKRKNNDGVAEAALIALYGYQEMKCEQELGL